VARERYRLLWDITIDGRLAAAGHRPMQARQHHARAFARSYSFWAEPKLEEAFTGLWQNHSPRHQDLVALLADPRGLRQTPGPVPGASCPLCDFPTFDWAALADVSAGVIERVAAEFPMWHPEDGLCLRCLETYQAALQYGNATIGSSCPPSDSLNLQ
jgi:hypothetical protein